MKLVVVDGYTENPGDLSWAGLEVLGELTVYDRTSYTESPLIAERIGDAEIVVMNKTPISRATIDACPNIRLIAVLATGYNVVDYQYAREKGIPVVNVPAYGTASVSQYSIALLLEISQRVCPRGQVGLESRLVLLGLSAHRAGGQDHRHHRLRPHRAGRGAHCTGNGHARSGIRCLSERRRARHRRVCRSGHTAARVGCRVAALQSDAREHQTYQ